MLNHTVMMRVRRDSIEINSEDDLARSLCLRAKKIVRTSVGSNVMPHGISDCLYYGIKAQTAAIVPSLSTM